MLTQQVLNGLITGSVYALFSLGFTLIFGVHRLLNLAHGIVGHVLACIGDGDGERCKARADGIGAELAWFGGKRGTAIELLTTELVPLALSDRAGEATFHVSSGRPPDLFAGENWNYGNKSSSLLVPAATGPMHGWIEFKEAITVRTGTLDDFCAQRGLARIDFIQMDVQGAEQLVLAGAAAMLPRITAIWLEVSAREHYRGQALGPAAQVGKRLAAVAQGLGEVVALQTAVADRALQLAQLLLEPGAIGARPWAPGFDPTLPYGPDYRAVMASSWRCGHSWRARTSRRCCRPSEARRNPSPTATSTRCWGRSYFGRS